uniref:Uncharacterized protein n=1 Tax=Anguilla anguilla TaxID=7936 RepID=A0A0E9PJL3_ANGAN
MRVLEEHAGPLIYRNRPRAVGQLKTAFYKPWLRDCILFTFHFKVVDRLVLSFSECIMSVGPLVLPISSPAVYLYFVLITHN